MTLEEILRASSAEQQLQAGGSLMANRQPEWRRSLPQALGPTAGTAAQAGLSLLDALLGMVGPSPLDAIGGGGSQAILGPIRTAGQKKMVSGLARKAPDLLDILRKSRETVNLEVKPSLMEPRASGSLTGGNELLRDMWINVNPNVMRGRLPAALERPDITGANNIFANAPAVVAHEAQHAANRIAGINSLEDNSFKLQNLGRGAAYRLQNQGLEGAAETLRDGAWGDNPFALADEGLAYLRQNYAAGRPVQSALLEALNRLHPRLGELFLAAQPPVR